MQDNTYTNTHRTTITKPIRHHITLEYEHSQPTTTTPTTTEEIIDAEFTDISYSSSLDDEAQYDIHPDLDLSSPLFTQLIEKATLTPLTKLNATRGFLAVSHLASWCEYQSYLELFHGPSEQIQTVQMQNGTKVHEILEAQVHDIVYIETATVEDRLALRFLNTLTTLYELLSKGVTRELPVFGLLPDLSDENGVIPIMGIVDHIERRTDQIVDALTGEMVKKEIYVLIDTKTRTVQSLNPKPVIRSNYTTKNAELQVKVYKYLFDELVRGNVDAGGLLRHYCKRYSLLDPTRPFSSAFQNEIKSMVTTWSGILNEPDNVTSLAGLVDLCVKAFRVFPLIHDTLELHYYAVTSQQTDYTFLGTLSTQYDHENFVRKLNNVVEFWTGKRPPKGVEVEEASKCRNCKMADLCEWRDMKARELAERGRI